LTGSQPYTIILLRTASSTLGSQAQATMPSLLVEMGASLAFAQAGLELHPISTAQVAEITVPGLIILIYFICFHIGMKPVK
jgi:hypothetical protein